MKKEPTTDAVEILHRRYGNGFFKRLRRRLHAWKYRRQLRAEVGAYNEGYDIGERKGRELGYAAGWAASQKAKEKYPYL